MRGLKKKLLLILAAGFDEIVDWQQALTSPYVRLKLASYKSDYFQKTMSEMLKTGEIERIIKDGEPYFRITSRGKIKLARSVPVAKRIGEKWDGRWRMVIFDIPELSRNKRDELRRKLQGLGFAKWQESVYITPFDIAMELAEYLHANNLEDTAVALEAKKIFVGNEKTMANKLWHLDDLNQKYLELIQGFKKEKVNFWQEKYLSLIEKDPFLPGELLPEVWHALEAKKLFNNLATTNSVRSDVVRRG